MFIPVEGKGQRKHPKVLTAREAIAKEPETKAVPCCTLACASRAAVCLSARWFAAGRKHFQAALTLLVWPGSISAASTFPRGPGLPGQSSALLQDSAAVLPALPRQGAGAVWRRRAG